MVLFANQPGDILKLDMLPRGVDITYLTSYYNLCRKTIHVFGGTSPLDTPSHVAQHPPTHGDIVWIPSDDVDQEIGELEEAMESALSSLAAWV